MKVHLATLPTSLMLGLVLGLVLGLFPGLDSLQAGEPRRAPERLQPTPSPASSKGITALDLGYPPSCFAPGLLPSLEESYVTGTELFDYETVVPDANNPGPLRADIGVRAWRVPCHTNGSALLLEIRTIQGLPLAPPVLLAQNDQVAEVRISYEAHTRVTNDSSTSVPLFDNEEGRTVYVIGASDESRALGMDFNGEITLGVRDVLFDVLLDFPAYDPGRFGIGGFQPIDPRHSGAWFNRARDGEGFFVEVFDRDDGSRGVFISWYTYLGGQQLWLVGEADFSPGMRNLEIPVLRASGPGFGDAFDSRDVVTEDWGSLRLRFRSCDTLRLDYDGVDGSGTLELARLTSIADHGCR